MPRTKPKVCSCHLPIEPDQDRTVCSRCGALLDRIPGGPGDAPVWLERKPMTHIPEWRWAWNKTKAS